jgi:hypothetical protein
VLLDLKLIASVHLLYSCTLQCHLIRIHIAISATFAWCAAKVWNRCPV